jgi:SAM-dependent methyltransferase
MSEARRAPASDAGTCGGASRPGTAAAAIDAGTPGRAAGPGAPVAPEPDGRAAELHVLWHDLECGAYAADLPLWRELAGEAGGPPGPLLDVGCGSGRVALQLGRAGYDVVGLDCDPVLLAALRERAGELAVEAVQADACDFALGRRFALILAPMQTVQLLGGPERRAAFLRCALAHLRPGGLLACAIADALEGFDAEHTEPPLPDVLERDGWVYASQPVAVRPEPDGTTIERIRQTVSPGGARTAEGDAVVLDRLDGDALEAEGVAAGLLAAGRRFVEMTDDHVGSEIVLWRAPEAGDG